MHLSMLLCIIVRLLSLFSPPLNHYSPISLFQFPAGSVIFKTGDNVDGLYIVGRGSIEIFVKDVHLGVLKANEFFGEIALMDRCQRTASARAVQNSVLLFLSCENFER